MRRLLCVGALMVGRAFSLDIDSLPVWNPDILSHKADAAVPADTAHVENRLETHGYKTMQVTVGDGGTQVDQELRLSIQGDRCIAE